MARSTRARPSGTPLRNQQPPGPSDRTRAGPHAPAGRQTPAPPVRRGRPCPSPHTADFPSGFAGPALQPRTGIDPTRSPNGRPSPDGTGDTAGDPLAAACGLSFAAPRLGPKPDGVGPRGGDPIRGRLETERSCSGVPSRRRRAFVFSRPSASGDVASTAWPLSSTRACAPAKISGVAPAVSLGHAAEAMRRSARRQERPPTFSPKADLSPASGKGDRLSLLSVEDGALARARV